MTPMLRPILIASTVLTAQLAAVPVQASSSAWHDAQGARIRLVTTGLPDAWGHLSGALQIDLNPGWKTYWRDPGDAGVPPTIDVTAAGLPVRAELAFPPPARFDDGYSIWSGYPRSVVFPVTFALPPGAAGEMSADIFLGVCEKICIPVQAKLSVDPASAPGDPAAAALVRTALAALPQPARTGFRAIQVPGDDVTLAVEVEFPGPASGVDLFLAGIDGYQFGTPHKAARDGRLYFTAAILARPEGAPAGSGLPYTLTSAGEAVAGALPYP